MGGLVVVVVVVWVFGRVEVWGGDLDGEKGEGFAELGMGGDGAGVGFDGEGCVET